MMLRLVLINLTIGATVATSVGPDGEVPDPQEFHHAMEIYALKEVSSDGMLWGHCPLVEELKCRALPDRNRAACEYRILSVRATAVLERSSGAWKWVSGDTPRCSAAIMK